jgi:hypothetical protein
VRSLQRLGLITVLETIQTAPDLAKAERWWIAFGRACGWPLTNIMDGGYPSEEIIIERWRRKAARAAARTDARAARLKEILLTREQHKAASEERMRSFCSMAGIKPPQHLLDTKPEIPTEIEQQCLQFFEANAVNKGDLISAAMAKARVTREAATQIYVKWSSLQGLRAQSAEVRDLCFQLFDKHIGSDQLLTEVALGARVPIEVAARFFHPWTRHSYQRGRDALKKDQEALLARYAAAQNRSTPYRNEGNNGSS